MALAQALSGALDSYLGFGCMRKYVAKFHQEPGMIQGRIAVVEWMKSRWVTCGEKNGRTVKTRIGVVLLDCRMIMRQLPELIASVSRVDRVT